MISSRILSYILKKELKRCFQLFDSTKTFPITPSQKHTPRLLYVHIPFCETLCPYCSFNRFAFNENAARSYFKSLKGELGLLSEMGYDFEAMYIGGGTPTILVDELREIIEISKSYFHINRVSCETNPNHLNDAVVKQLEGLVQRMSVGVQTFSDTLLEKINRYERFGSGVDLFDKVTTYRDAFPTLNVDMIFNFPDQTREMVLRDAEKILQSGVKQATFYPFMATSSTSKLTKGALGRLASGNQKMFYKLIREFLGNEYRLSTAWTFSRGKQCLIDEYVVDYPDYIGAGSGAFSYTEGRLHVNTFHLGQYGKQILKQELPVSGYREFSKTDQMRYYFMMKLFGLELSKKEFQTRFMVPVEKGLWKEMLFLGSAGAFDENSREKIVLSPKGQYLLLVMMKEFFTAVNTLRDQARKTAHK